jgi:RND family efflux transporter MFP subunit
MIGTPKYRNVFKAAFTCAIIASLAGCSDNQPPQAKPRPVLVTTVHNLPDGYDRTFTGVVRARYETDQSFRTGGKVVTRMVETGQMVKAGQPIARLDPTDHELAAHGAADQLEAARADAAQAVADETRFRRLLADHSVAVADHERQKARADAATARHAQAQRQLALAQNRMKYTTLLAEFDGVVTSVRFEIGQMVAEGQPVVTIARTSELEVVADLPEELVRVAQSLAATASFWDMPNLVVPLKLRELSPSAATQTRTFRARFSIVGKSRSQVLHLGTTASLNLKEVGAERAALLPATALLKSDGKSIVWIVNDSGKHLVAKQVEVIGYTDESVLVRGLPEGAKVVSAGIQKLDAGLDVSPVERSASGTNLGSSEARSAKSGMPKERL